VNKSRAGNKCFCGDTGEIYATTTDHHGVALNQGHFVILFPQVGSQDFATFPAADDDGVVLLESLIYSAPNCICTALPGRSLLPERSLGNGGRSACLGPLRHIVIGSSRCTNSYDAY
jgi:hypothetical protein